MHFYCTIGLNSFFRIIVSECNFFKFKFAYLNLYWIIWKRYLYLYLYLIRQYLYLYLYLVLQYLYLYLYLYYAVLDPSLVKIAAEGICSLGPYILRRLVFINVAELFSACPLSVQTPKKQFLKFS